MDDIYYVTIVTIHNAIHPPSKYKSRCILRDTVTPFSAISYLNRIKISYIQFERSLECTWRYIFLPLCGLSYLVFMHDSRVSISGAWSFVPLGSHGFPYPWGGLGVKWLKGKGGHHVPGVGNFPEGFASKHPHHPGTVDHGWVRGSGRGAVTALRNVDGLPITPGHALGTSLA